DGTRELRRVGKPVMKKMISLETAGVTDLGKWNRFTLDLTQLINTEPGAVYQVKVGFRKSYLAYVCEDGEQTELANDMTGFDTPDGWSEPDDDENSYWDSYEDYYYSEDYDWRERDNPCHNSYYTGQRTITRNLLASDFCVIAKRGGDNNTHVFVTDLKTTQPLNGVLIEAYSYQQQLIGTATTGGDGKAVVQTK